MRFMSPATHVNGTAIETGMYPEHNGVIANYDYFVRRSRRRSSFRPNSKRLFKKVTLYHMENT